MDPFPNFWRSWLPKHEGRMVVREGQVQTGFQARLFGKERTAIQEVEFGGRTGFEAIQFRGHAGPAKRTEFGDLASLSACLAEHRIEPTMELVIGLDDRGLMDDGRSPVEILRNNLDIIAALGIRYVHWHLYRLTPPSEAVRQRLAGVIQRECEAGVALAEEAGFLLGIENNSPEGFLLIEPGECLSLLDSVGKLGFVWDLNHTPRDLAEDFHAVAGRVSLLHISDTPLPALNQHLPIGMGNIDFHRHLGAMLAAGFSGPAILEIGGPPGGGQHCDTDDALADSLHKLKCVF